MEEIGKTLSKNPVVYVTRDLERAIGLGLDTPGFYIISNSSGFAKSLTKDRTHIVLIENSRPLDTHELLTRASEKGIIESFTFESKPNLMVFKNTALIEQICSDKGWNLLNPSAKLASKVEEKISQVEWLGPISRYLPLHEIKLCREAQWPGRPFILQFNRSHTGLGTILLENKENLEIIQSKFPQRPVRVSEYIRGPSLTINNIVARDGSVITGNLSYQITGIKPFSFQKFATIGNDWALGLGFSAKEKIAESIKNISKEIGKKLHQEGWRGLFGLDFIMDEKSERLYLLEINMRQPASASFESILQDKARQNETHKKIQAMTLFELHVLSLLNEDTTKTCQSIPIEDGAQIILRNSDEISMTEEKRGRLSTQLENSGFNTMIYEGQKTGADLIRIQSPKGIMKKHNQFNEIGEQIQEALKNQISSAYENRKKKNLNEAPKKEIHKAIQITRSKTAKAEQTDSDPKYPGLEAKKEDILTLSDKTLGLIENYEHLKWGRFTISCPYINNKRAKLRAGLGVMIGKGSPQEIIEEAELLALQKNIPLEEFKPEQIKQFLVENGLGVDCSGFAYHVLEAESVARGKAKLKKQIRLASSINPLRNLIKNLRHLENTNVETLADSKNSVEILLSEIRPGDMIVILKSGTDQMRDHIAIISSVEYADGLPISLEYVHAQRWSTDGLYQHGARRGIIKIQDLTQNLLKQTWIEQGLSGDKNETLRRAKNAKSLSIRRLRSFCH
ncbi:MAG: hypothetical protein HYY51_04495 [Candidatus Magasanikbacteria bacterium]|nr:hypothetical protein [Candidatus Magasanikbacteria bacterium]